MASEIMTPAENDPTASNAVRSAFDRARAEDRSLLIGYWPAGFPDADASVRLIEAMVANGVDMVEVGIPYSDPLMDGPVIAAAADEALRSGMTPRRALGVVERVAELDVPILVMTYWNLIEQYGSADFARSLAAVGGVGVIAPDLTVEEAGPWISASDDEDISRVLLAAPSSSSERLAVVAEASSGFVYAASLMGVTGTREAVAASAQELVAKLRVHTDLPVAVGLGVSTGPQAREIAAYADGVIVGSAFVRLLHESTDLDEAVQRVGELAVELAAAVRR